MTAQVQPVVRPGPGLRGRLGKALPYLLLAPGLLWLLVFYVLPVHPDVHLLDLDGVARERVHDHADGGRVRRGAHEVRQAVPQLDPVRRRCATILTFLIGFPVAYTIAFRGGRYKNLILFLVIAPFFTSFLIRTISWKILLGDDGPVFGPLKHILGLLPGDFSILATPVARGRRASPTTSCRS